MFGPVHTISSLYDLEISRIFFLFFLYKKQLGQKERKCIAMRSLL